MALGIEIVKGDLGAYTVKLAGQLDSDTAGQLGERIVEVWEDARARAIRMDLHELTYISSLGLGMLLKIRKTLAPRGGAMVIAGAQPQIVKVFEIVKMLPQETVFATREEADAYLAAIQERVKNP